MSTEIGEVHNAHMFVDEWTQQQVIMNHPHYKQAILSKPLMSFLWSKQLNP